MLLQSNVGEAFCLPAPSMFPYRLSLLYEDQIITSDRLNSNEIEKAKQELAAIESEITNRSSGERKDGEAMCVNYALFMIKGYYEMPMMTLTTRMTRMSVMTTTEDEKQMKKMRYGRGRRR